MPSGTAQLWIDDDGGECTRSASARSYDDRAACRDAQAAYDAASCGDTVRYKPGSYEALSITRGSKACADATMVLFRPGDDARNTRGTTASVVITSIELAAASSGSNGGENRWVEVRDIDTYSGSTTAGSVNIDTGDVLDSHTRLVRVDTRKIFMVAGHVEIRGGSAGGFNACDDGDGGDADAVKIWEEPDQGAGSHEIVVDGIFVRHMGPTVTCSDHSDGLQMLSPRNVTIRDSTFVSEADEDLIGRPHAGPMSNVTVERNSFAAPGGVQNIVLGSSDDACSNIVVRDNRGRGVIRLSCAGGGTGNSYTGNVATRCVVVNATSSDNVGTESSDGCRDGRWP